MHRLGHSVCFVLFSFLLAGCSGTGPENEGEADRRDVYQQPFSQKSIWNMPIGSDAEYVPAEIGAPTEWGVTADEDAIILRPDASLTEVVYNGVGWSDDTPGARCEKQGDVLFRAPIPDGYYLPHERGTPNSAAAILARDERTLYQAQPLHRCEEQGGHATALVEFPSVDIYGDGIEGAHGGSGLSSIGGTLRVGELEGERKRIPHALKVNLYAEQYLAYNEDDTPGYRWPAVTADNYAEEGYGGTVPELEMGALLALKPSFDVASLQTEPGKIIARTFKDYGGYVVDDTAWDVFALATERGPDGRFLEAFEDTWGFPFEVQALDHPWAEDMRRIFTHLHVVDNNAADNIGGGGEPRRPLAPEVSPEE